MPAITVSKYPQNQCICTMEDHFYVFVLVDGREVLDCVLLQVHIWGFFKDESRFNLKIYSAICWSKEISIPSTTNSSLWDNDYRKGGIIIMDWIILSAHSDLHVFHEGIVNVGRYRNEIKISKTQFRSCQWHHLNGQ